MKYAEQILNNESARCMLCAEAPCTAACPEGFDPARFVRAARFENAAVGAGYVSAARCAECSGECESACLHYESPVKIREMIKAAPEPVKAEELTADLSMEFCGVKRQRAESRLGRHSLQDDRLHQTGRGFTPVRRHRQGIHPVRWVQEPGADLRPPAE